MEGFSLQQGSIIGSNIIKTIQHNKQYLSDLDGMVGDGDHGINMNKGATLCAAALEKSPGNLAHALSVLSKMFMGSIGGAMGPLYGMFFQGMANACEGKETIDRAVFEEMLKCGEAGIRSISDAKVGDKTMMDTLAPAITAYSAAVGSGKDFSESLEAMREAAIKGRDSTKGLVAKVGRSSRLGERSRGVLDAGAVSLCLVLESMADSIEGLIQENNSPPDGGPVPLPVEALKSE
jgi:dihydroxyacetone kinase-like protein